MARVEKVRLVDDLTGEDADETVGFVVDGVGYEIDLATAHAAALRAVLAPYVEAGRATVPRRRSSRPATSSMSTERRQHSNAIRAWARQHGHTISDRGRIPMKVVDAYERQAGRTGGAPRPRATTSTAVAFQAAG